MDEKECDQLDLGNDRFLRHVNHQWYHLLDLCAYLGLKTRHRLGKVETAKFQARQGNGFRQTTFIRKPYLAHFITKAYDVDPPRLKKIQTLQQKTGIKVEAPKPKEMDPWTTIKKMRELLDDLYTNFVSEATKSRISRNKQMAEGMALLFPDTKLKVHWTRRQQVWCRALLHCTCETGDDYTHGVVHYFRLNKGYEGRTQDIHALSLEDLVEVYGVQPEVEVLRTWVYNRPVHSTPDGEPMVFERCTTTLIPATEFGKFVEAAPPRTLTATITSFLASSQSTS